MKRKHHHAALAAAFALGLILAPLLTAGPTLAQPAAALTRKQADALKTYNDAVKDFTAVLAQRRAQIDAKQPLPNLPGQALYHARNNMISVYKDLSGCHAGEGRQA